MYLLCKNNKYATPYKILQVQLQRSSYFTPSVAIAIYIWQWKMRIDSVGFYGCFAGFFIYCTFTSQSKYFFSSPSCDCQLKKWKSSHLNYGSLKETSILTMSALTGDCLDWTCRMEAAQCLLLLIPVVWLLPDVLPNSAVPAKHGN